MNPKKPQTVSVRIREETYNKIATDSIINNTKSVEVVEAMASLWFELTPAERSIRLGGKPKIASQSIDANGLTMGSYLASS